ncbi:MAG: hypothetical protein IKD53_01450 [Clostridia bacterium]|nr:hypothetical protein [Clostridia bacterium]
MGVISILLGIIAFIAFTGAGAILGNELVSLKTMFAASLTTLANVSSTSIMVGMIGVFGFIGLLIGISLIMQGLTYNKVVKIQKKLRRL